MHEFQAMAWSCGYCNFYIIIIIVNAMLHLGSFGLRIQSALWEVTLSHTKPPFIFFSFVSLWGDRTILETESCLFFLFFFVCLF